MMAIKRSLKTNLGKVLACLQLKGGICVTKDYIVRKTGLKLSSVNRAITLLRKRKLVGFAGRVKRADNTFKTYWGAVMENA